MLTNNVPSAGALENMVTNSMDAGNNCAMLDLRAMSDPAGRTVPQEGLTVWFTGLSGSGKSTLCNAVHKALAAENVRLEVLDGDRVRKQLSKDLGFSKADRDENVRRIGVVAKTLASHGYIVLVAAISPYQSLRAEIRGEVGRFIEVHVHAPLEVCERRDPKGLYKRARSGSLQAFTGITDPYEAPLRPEVRCDTDVESLARCVEKVVSAIHGYQRMTARRRVAAAEPEHGVRINMSKVGPINALRDAQ